jgi:hypothetical protein
MHTILIYHKHERLFIPLIILFISWLCFLGRIEKVNLYTKSEGVMKKRVHMK